MRMLFWPKKYTTSSWATAENRDLVRMLQNDKPSTLDKAHYIVIVMKIEYWVNWKLNFWLDENDKN